MKKIKGQLTNLLRVILFPENKNKISGKVDLIRLDLMSIEEKLRHIDMTPDEALEIYSLLATAIQFYLSEGNKSYNELFKKRKKIAKIRKKKGFKLWGKESGYNKTK